MSEVYTRQRNGKWEYRFEKAPIDGKRKQASKCGFRTKKDALEAGTKALAEYNNCGQSFAPSEMSVADYMDEWLRLYCSVNVKDTTMAAYEKKIRLYIKPALGEYRLKAITAANIQKFLNDKFDEGFSRNTLSVLKGILTGSLTYAVTPLQYLPFNPALMVKLPLTRAKAKNVTRRKIRRPVTPSEWEQIMERFPEGHPAHIPLVLAYRCGLRLGEGFGLMWDDIDFENNTMRVDRQVQYKGDTIEFTPPKYDSYRTIYVDADTMALLRRERDKQQRARIYYENAYKQLFCRGNHANEHVFDNGVMTYEPADGISVYMIMSRDCGEYIQPRIMQHVGRIIHGTYKDGRPVISAEWDFHSLRHTHATQLTEAGVPMAIIQERLGHAKIEMTEHYSAHITPTMEANFKNTLSTLYKQKTSAPSTPSANEKIADNTRTNADV